MDYLFFSHAMRIIFAKSVLSGIGLFRALHVLDNNVHFTAILRELQGIALNVHQDLLQAQLVALNHHVDR